MLPCKRPAQSALRLRRLNSRVGRVQDKVALVTGGASGIGRATCLLLAHEGAKVAVADLDLSGAEAVAADIRGRGGPSLALPLDVVEEADWQRVVAAVVDAWGDLDILVNSAGIGAAKPILDTSLADWRRMMAINLDGVFLGTKAGIAVMRQRGGSIVNLSSVLGIVGRAGSAAYSASKGGVRLFSKSAALECAANGWNIRVNSVHPGYIATPMVESHLARAADPAAARRGVEQYHPVRRLGRAEEIAEGILYLASDAASFTTGSELVIDGALTAR